MNIFDLFKQNKKTPEFETHTIMDNIKREHGLKKQPYFCQSCHICQHGTERDNDCCNHGLCPYYHRTKTSKIDYLNPKFATKDESDD